MKVETLKLKAELAETEGFQNQMNDIWNEGMIKKDDKGRVVFVADPKE